MINILFSWSDVGNAIGYAFRWLLGLISNLIYDMIVYAYDLFNLISRAKFLDNDFVQSIYQKVGLILGLFMLFKLIFSGIQALIDPNKLSDKKSGYTAIISRSIIAIVLLGVTPTIFKEAFVLQDLLTGANNNNENIIYKLIIGKPIDTNDGTFGQVIASELYFSFFRDDESPHLDQASDPDSGESLSSTDSYNQIQSDVHNKGFSSTQRYLKYQKDGEYVIEFNEIFSPLVGGVVLWILLMYCIQIAIRVFQLAYLQLIAPIPILSYISDSEGTFSKWIKQCTATYLDLFIRLAIIYFIMYFASYVLEQINNADSILRLSLGGVEGFTLGLVKVFLIIGLLLFAKKVPDLLKDLFPNMGGGAAGLSFGLKPQKEVTNFAKGAGSLAAGAAVGGIAGIATGIKYGENARGKIAGGLGGFFRGAASARTKGGVIKNAQKGISNVRAANQRAYERHHDGSTFWGRHGFDNHAKESFERELKASETLSQSYDALMKSVGKDSRVQYANQAKENLMKTGIAQTDLTLKVGSGYVNYKKGQAISTDHMATAIKHAEDEIKATENTVINDAIANPSAFQEVSNNLHNVEAARQNAVSQGVQGLGTDDVSVDVDKLREAKKANEQAAHDIKDVGGSRHEEYTTAQANANYRKK